MLEFYGKKILWGPNLYLVKLSRNFRDGSTFVNVDFTIDKRM